MPSTAGHAHTPGSDEETYDDGFIQDDDAVFDEGEGEDYDDDFEAAISTAINKKNEAVLAVALERSGEGGHNPSSRPGSARMDTNHLAGSRPESATQSGSRPESASSKRSRASPRSPPNLEVTRGGTSQDRTLVPRRRNGRTGGRPPAEPRETWRIRIGRSTRDAAT